VFVKKLTLEEIKTSIEKYGYSLLSKEYTNSQSNLAVICPNQHETKITWNNFQKGQRCKFCAGNVKYDLQKVKEIFSNKNCELLESKYKNNNELLEFKCRCGNISKIRLSDFLRNRFCKNCKAKTNSEKLRTPEAKIADICQKHDCQLIRSWIQCKKTRIEYICKCGNQTEAYLTNFKNYPNCWECGKKKKSGTNCYMYDPDRDAVKMRKRFRKMCGQFIHRYMRATGEKKTRYTHELLGYTPQQLQNHILNHPNMKLCEEKEWHVDHYFPIQAFLDAGIYDLKIINCLPNLRPMPGPENLSKADRYDEKEFKKWLSEKQKNNLS
jgi:hypothetical protein